MRAIERIASFFFLRNDKDIKHRKHRAKQIKRRNLFFTGRPFLMYHISQTVIFWLVAIIFPIVSVLGCERGHAWMSHIAIAFYLLLTAIFDFILMLQYCEKQGKRRDLYWSTLKNDPKVKRPRCQGCGPFWEGVWEMILTVISQMDIYTDIAFITIALKEGL